LQRRLKTKILLTATPFQLDPRQWNGLAANIVKSGAKVMRVPVVAKYIEMLSDVFEKGSVEGPPPRLVADASSVMQDRGTDGVLYCLVPDTYDERMFHQLVARDRWHEVLLGKPATRLKDEKRDAALLDRRRLARLRLDLAPR
jgi:hypothetical protein